MLFRSRKFYFFTHNCKDNTNEVLTELKKKFDIKIFTLSSESNVLALKCFQDSYDNFGNEVDWMAYIDGDEFLFPTHADSLEKPLNEFLSQKISALGVYWACFGSNGYIEEPTGLIIENYKRRPRLNYTNNRHIKSIVRGGQGKSVKVSGTHTFTTPFGTYDEKLRPVTNGWTDYEPTYEKFRINHYVCQSRSFYLNWKKESGYIDSGAIDRFSVRGEDWWKEHDRNDVFDHSMDKYIKPLKKILDAI